MATEVTVGLNVRIPELHEFQERYPQYKNFATGPEGQALFALIMRPQSFVKAEVATVDLGLPGVAGVAKDCADAVPTELTDTQKRFCGALVCALMEANGFSKTGRKRAIPHKAFTKGEVYTFESGTAGLNWRPVNP